MQRERDVDYRANDERGLPGHRYDQRTVPGGHPGTESTTARVHLGAESADASVHLVAVPAWHK